ncbi:MAG: TonB-dependent receptor, partial [Treponema sp.]|nr:TonB-dependent receptor [Treponema sp.]
MKPERVLFFLLLGLLVFVPGFLFARDVEVTVEDADLEMPLEGAVILLRNGEEYVCDEDGKALVTLPDDGPAVIRVAYPGYESRRMTVPAESAEEEGPRRITVVLKLGGVLESRELVLEAERPGTSETKSGRSVALSDRELARTAEIGIIEDVMTSIKLLPGVGYSGMFNALPSIRGGDPGDLMAVLDGFYLERPYHWGGGFSIFDPKMVSSARLSHGVFSSRYGHTISGLLEVSSKTPSPTEAELEAAIGSSAASLNLSFPLAGKGGILFMGKVTYWDTLVWAVKGLSRAMPDNETLGMINSVSTAPFIRSAALSANYRFTGNLEMKVNGFFGSDGVGAAYRNVYDEEEIRGNMNMDFEYGNYQGFLIAGLTFNPIPSMVLKGAAGGGFIRTTADGFIDNRVTVRYNQKFLDEYTGLGLTPGQSYTAPNVNANLDTNMTIANFQGRVDLDWDLGRGFIAAAGVQELYSLWKQREDIDLFLETPIADLPPWVKASLPDALFPIKNFPDAAIIRPMGYTGDVRNQGFTTSGYGLVEYASPNQKFGAELGLRVDHLYFLGRDFSVRT